jgi:hypothetical protein
VQAVAWKNKQAKGFNLTDGPLEFGLLTAEIGDAFTAWSASSRSTLGESTRRTTAAS